MKHKERLDVLLVARNLAESRSKAQAMIMAGEVYVNEQKADKAGLEINIDDEPVVEVRGSACPCQPRRVKAGKGASRFPCQSNRLCVQRFRRVNRGIYRLSASAGSQQGFCH